MPKVIATIEMRIIGFEKEFLSPLMILFAKKSSKFKKTTLVFDKFREMRQQIFGWRILFVLLLALPFLSCAQQQSGSEVTKKENSEPPIVLGNARTALYLPFIKNKSVGLVGNHTSMIGGTHLVDSLLKLGIKIKTVFSPEHGFRGEADAGEKVENELDKKTGLPIISLYGDNKKPTKEQLKGIDILLFDIQDVGARFYTYISTLHYVMEAAAENDIPLIVLDKPNPNGHYVDGPILDLDYQSFVGLHPVPVVHGLTIGEYAQMINGEKWLKDGMQCRLRIIACMHYYHKRSYELPIAPSPNLPNMKAVYLYPSLCFFEGTPISVGRGTSKPFQQIGHPDLEYEYTFVPKPSYGAQQPKLEGKNCNGIDLSETTKKALWTEGKIDLSYLLEFYKGYPDNEQFFTNFFPLLSGSKELQRAIMAEKTISEIEQMWEEGLKEYQKKRKEYLLYEDFD